MAYSKKQFAAETAILEAICLFEIHSSISHHIKDIKMSMCQYCVMRNDRLRFSSISSPKNRCYCWMEGDFAFQFAGMMYWRTIYSVDLLICHFENVAFSLILTLEIAYSERSCRRSPQIWRARGSEDEERSQKERIRGKEEIGSWNGEELFIAVKEEQVEPSPDYKCVLAHTPQTCKLKLASGDP